MTGEAVSPAPKAETGRKASKEVRKKQLIDATISVLAEKGYASLTVADVARVAGLSTGIVIFHFESKDKLLASVLQHLVEEYWHAWKQALATAPDSAAGRLSALVLADFDPEIFTPAKISTWIAFWAEGQGRPVYDEICAKHDAERFAAGLACCEALIKEGGYDLDARLTTHTLDALGDGLWLGVSPTETGYKDRSRPEDCRRTMEVALAAMFPRHFSMPRG